MVKIQVEDSLKDCFNFDFEKNIKIILKYVPKEHIVGLCKIEAIRFSPEKHRRQTYGFYYGEREGEKFPKIVVCAENILGNLPKIIFHFPFIPRIFLGMTIYHEIGHHYQRLRHGIEKKRWEKDADVYQKMMTRRAFKFQLLFLGLLFWPFLLLRRMEIKRKLKTLSKTPTMRQL